MTINTGDMLTLHNGKTAQALKPGQRNTFKAQAGDHYRIVKHVDEKEQLLDDVIATRSGDDLHLSQVGWARPLCPRVFYIAARKLFILFNFTNNSKSCLGIAAYHLLVMRIIIVSS
ncbi:MAG: hypothetical protein V4568_00640 [Pseudomonadota bacterium]